LATSYATAWHWDTVGRAGEEWLPERLLGRVAGSPRFDNVKGNQGHEIPVHGDIHTIVGGFSRGGCTTSQRKKYARAVMSVEAQEADQALDVDLVFTRIDFRDVVPHDNNPVVISVVTA